MSIQLPSPIDRYVQLENSGEVEALAECFALEAIALDEGHTYEGVAAILEWKKASRQKFNHTVRPLDVVERDGKTILTAEVAGNFPGSPVTLAYAFEVKNGKIVALGIA